MIDNKNKTIDCDGEGCREYVSFYYRPFQAAIREAKAKGWKIRPIGAGKVFRHHCPNCKQTAKVVEQTPPPRQWWNDPDR